MLSFSLGFASPHVFLEAASYERRTRNSYSTCDQISTRSVCINMPLFSVYFVSFLTYLLKGKRPSSVRLNEVTWLSYPSHVERGAYFTRYVVEKDAVIHLKGGLIRVLSEGLSRGALGHV